MLLFYTLADSELLSQSSDREFLVRGTHGMVFPWPPPLFGIPVKILQKLEKKLIEKLVEEVSLSKSPDFIM